MSEQWIDLSRKVVVVTGGSMGLGEKMVDSLASNGAIVVSADVSEKNNYSTKRNIDSIFCDVTKKDSIEKLVRLVVEKYGRIDVLVNNAGVSRPRMVVDYYGEKPEYELSEEDFDFMTNVNQKGVFLCSQAIAKVMVKQNAGVIINMSSEAGLEGSKGQSCYSGNKAAVHAYTMAWAKELGPFNIRVVGIAPGINEPTPMNSKENFEALAYTRGTDPSQVHQDYKNIIPLGRPGKMTEISDLVTYLASDYASYISGTTINITGAKSTR